MVLPGHGVRVTVFRGTLPAERSFLRNPGFPDEGGQDGVRIFPADTRIGGQKDTVVKHRDRYRLDVVGL